MRVVTASTVVMLPKIHSRDHLRNVVVQTINVWRIIVSVVGVLVPVDRSVSAEAVQILMELQATQAVDVLIGMII